MANPKKTHFSKHIDYDKSQSFLAEQPPFSINVSNSWHMHINSHDIAICLPSKAKQNK
jgi:zona occludens toxin (predicted ATPase)